MNGNKGIKILVLCLFCFTAVRTQNLVPNSNFENFIACPANPGEISGAISWNGYGSADYFNSCANTIVGAPSNAVGYQNPFSGNAYAGVYAYIYNTSGLNQREFITTMLLDTLKNGVSYCVSFRLSLADSMFYSISNFGAYFSYQSEDPTLIIPPYLQAKNPQVTSPPLNYYLNKSGWRRFEEAFIALGQEQFVTIGNFDFDSAIDTLKLLSGAINNPNLYQSAYYYIDDVSVEEIKPVNAGTDKSIYIGDSVLIGLNMDSAATYAWWPHAGITDTTVLNPWVQPTQTTTYYVSKTQCSVTTTDTVVVVVNPIGIKENYFASNISVQPNPNNGNFTIEYTKLPKDCYLEIYELSGKFVYKQELLNTSSSIIIHLEELGSGLYIYKIKSTEGLLKTGKLIISK